MKQSADEKGKEYADQNPCRVNADVPDLAGSAGDKVLMQFVDAGVQHAQRKGQGNFLQTAGRILTDSGAEQKTQYGKNKQVGAFPEDKGAQPEQERIGKDFFHIVYPEKTQEEMQCGITGSRRLCSRLGRKPEYQTHPGKRCKCF